MQYMFTGWTKTKATEETPDRLTVKLREYRSPALWLVLLTATFVLGEWLRLNMVGVARMLPFFGSIVAVFALAAIFMTEDNLHFERHFDRATVAKPWSFSKATHQGLAGLSVGRDGEAGRLNLIFKDGAMLQTNAKLPDEPDTKALVARINGWVDAHTS